MRTTDIIWLLENTSNLNLLTKGTEWYLFGSILDSRKTSADIDLLVIYEDPDDAIRIREKIVDLEFHHPLDILLMTPQEADETNFVTSERCVQFFPRNEFMAPF